MDVKCLSNVAIAKTRLQNSLYADKIRISHEAAWSDLFSGVTVVTEVNGSKVKSTLKWHQIYSNITQIFRFWCSVSMDTHISQWNSSPPLCTTHGKRYIRISTKVYQVHWYDSMIDSTCGISHFWVIQLKKKKKQEISTVWHGTRHSVFKN